MALWTGLIRAWKSWIGTDVLGNTSSLALLVVEDVAEDAGRGGVLGELAGAARELEFVGLGVFFGVEHVGAGGFVSRCIP